MDPSVAVKDDRGLPNLITSLPLSGGRVQKSGPITTLFVVSHRLMGLVPGLFFHRSILRISSDFFFSDFIYLLQKEQEREH